MSPDRSELALFAGQLAPDLDHFRTSIAGIWEFPERSYVDCDMCTQSFLPAPYFMLGQRPAGKSLVSSIWLLEGELGRFISVQEDQVVELGSRMFVNGVSDEARAIAFASTNFDRFDLERPALIPDDQDD